MDIVLYSTGCPRCDQLKKALINANIKYAENNSVEDIKETGITKVPFLKIDGKFLEFAEAMEWINNKQNGGTVCTK